MKEYCHICLSEVKNSDEVCSGCSTARPSDGWFSLDIEGKTLQNGKYKVIAPFSVGAFGVVVKASHYDGDKLLGNVFIKFPINNTLNIVNLVEDLKAFSNVNHDNVLKLLDVFIEDDVPFLVMEYLEGFSLSEVIDKEELRDKLHLRDRFNIIAQLADAISYLHDNGVSVCDLHPSNILISFSDDETSKSYDVRIIDFLSSFAYQDRWWDFELVKKDFLGLISPEQFYDKPTLISDLYSLGVLIYLFLDLKQPYPVEILLNKNKWLKASPPSLPSWLPDMINDFVRRCINPQQKERYSSLSGFYKTCISCTLITYQEYDEEFVIKDAPTLLKLAREAFAAASIANPSEYARAARLFKRLDDMGKLPDTMRKFLDKSIDRSKNKAK